MEESLGYAPKDMGGAPPHKNNLIGRSPVGVQKSVCLKLTTTFGTLSLLLHSSTCSLADNPEASVALDPCLNIGLRKRAKRIQDFVKAVTPQSQQTNRAFHLNKETRSRQLRAAPVTSRSRRLPQQHVASETQASEISVKTPRNHVGDSAC